MKKIFQFLYQFLGVLVYPAMFLGAVLMLFVSPIMYVVDSIAHLKHRAVN
ncbi:MAG: hypothetical protein ABFC84_16065 [Veillonellales bacterium]